MLCSRGCVQKQIPGRLGSHCKPPKASDCGRQRIRCKSKICTCVLIMNADSQLGGGCELALMCDIILASPTAKFGQPEINLGVIPGGGGSQRLIHAIGKSRTMELVLTGRMISAQEASDWGMVSRVVGEGEGEVVKEAINMANTIASKSQLAVQAGKEVVNAGARPFFTAIHLPLTYAYSAAYEMTLAEGLRFERRIFHGLFATNDQKEGTLVYTSKSSFVPVPDFTAHPGMAAFAEKRKANFTHT